MKQREIKFRVWDKEKKGMLKSTFLAVNNLDNVLYYDALAEEWVRIENPENLVLMQYTGLHDKNGREIYCGDIVKGYFNSDEVEDWVWLGLTKQEIKNGWRIFEIPLNIVDFARTPYPDKLEAISNVFENPELLKQR